ncbi:hypothetical protein ACFQV2_02320 [Actinokineospora soli]|uniref:Uncharacterized protein n=1 Tax=Actinokineospora soli TaxID=1048753 RepID=A0ABW2THN1_9PSEU
MNTTQSPDDCPISEGEAMTEPTTNSSPHGRVWLNPPTDTTPPRRVLVEFTLTEARLVADALRFTAAGEHRELTRLARTVEMAVATPEQADADGVSRFDTEHPANQLSRLMLTALTELARWAGPVSVAANAVDYAAAIAAHRDGARGVLDLLTATRSKLRTVAQTGYGPVPPASTEQAGE